MNSGILILRGLGAGMERLEGKQNGRLEASIFCECMLTFIFCTKTIFQGFGSFFFAKNGQKVAKMAKKDRKGLTPRSKPLNLWGDFFFGMQSIFLSSSFFLSHFSIRAINKLEE